MRGKKRGPSTFRMVKDGKACTFGNLQISSSNLEKFEEKLNHFLHGRKEDVFIRCKTFHTCGGDLCRRLCREHQTGIINKTFTNPIVYNLTGHGKHCEANICQRKGVHQYAVDDAPYVGCSCGALARTETLLEDVGLVISFGDTKTCLNVTFALTPCEYQHPGDHDGKAETVKGYQCKSIDYCAESASSIIINDDTRGLSEYKPVNGKLL
jgi:hypothetical protein